MEISLHKHVSRAIPAPRGFYRLLSYRIGKGWFQFTDDVSREDPTTNIRYNGINSFLLGNVRRQELNWGYGYVHIFSNGFYLDGSLQVHMGWMDYDENYWSMISAYSSYIGPNLFILDRVIPTEGSGAFGLSFKAKVGYLF